MAPLIRFIHQATKLNLMASINLQQERGRYERYYYEMVKCERNFAAGRYVFVERPLLARNTSRRQAAESYSKLFSYRL